MSQIPVGIVAVACAIRGAIRPLGCLIPYGTARPGVERFTQFRVTSKSPHLTRADVAPSFLSIAGRKNESPVADRQKGFLDRRIES